MSEKAIQPQDKYVLRLPDGMRDRIRSASEASGRSMNAEIVKRLEASFDDLPFGFDFKDVRPQVLALLKDRIEHAAKTSGRSLSGEIMKRLEESFVPISYQLDLDGSGNIESKPEEWRRRQYYKALTEEDAVKQISIIASELNDAVEALNEIRSAREFADRRSVRDQD